MNFQVMFSPEAEEQLVALYRYIADVTSPETAVGYIDGIIDYCESLQTFPHRGTVRDDIRPGLRITNFKKHTVIAFSVEVDKWRAGVTRQLVNTTVSESHRSG
jgi:plasmid stabilization system protein ParE